MKELHGTSVNMCLLEGKKNNLIAMAEVILVLSEPQYQTDGDGGIVKVRAAEHFRFSAGAKSLRNLAESLSESADALEDLQERATLKPEEDEK